MRRTHRNHRPADAARTSLVIATTSEPRMLAPHTRATREIARARKRTDPHDPALPHTPEEHHMPRRRTLAAVLAAAALVAPAVAQAEPADMHASVAQALAKERAQTAPAQDLRSPDARDAGTKVKTPPAGQPTWPVKPQPIAAPAPQPVNHSDGSDVPVVPIAAGALLVLLAALIARHTTRRLGRARVAA